MSDLNELFEKFGKCRVCGGTGVLNDGDGCEECLCTGMTEVVNYVDFTTARITALEAENARLVAVVGYARHKRGCTKLDFYGHVIMDEYTFCDCGLSAALAASEAKG